MRMARCDTGKPKKSMAAILSGIELRNNEHIELITCKQKEANVTLTVSDKCASEITIEKSSTPQGSNDEGIGSLNIDKDVNTTVVSQRDNNISINNCNSYGEKVAIDNAGHCHDSANKYTLLEMNPTTISNLNMLPDGITTSEVLLKDNISESNLVNSEVGYSTDVLVTKELLQDCNISSAIDSLETTFAPEEFDPLLLRACVKTLQKLQDCSG